MAFVTVKGEVTRTFFNGKGAEVTESWQQNGETYKKRWSAFFENEHGLAEGAQVQVNGIHGDKVDQWEKDGVVNHNVKRTINQSEAKVLNAAPAAAAGDTWNDSETPF
jgi:ABC-type transporter Mla subunit MlaD